MALLGDIDSPIPQEDVVSNQLTPNEVVSSQPKAPVSPQDSIVRKNSNIGMFDLAPATIENASGYESSFGANLTASSEYGYKIGTEGGRQSVVNNQIDSQYKKLYSSGLVPQDLVSKLGKSTGGLFNTEYDSYLDWLKNNDEYINTIKASNPELGIKSYNDIYEDTRKEFVRITDIQRRNAHNQSTAGWWGDILGSMAGYTQDPTTAAIGGVATIAGATLAPAILGGAAVANGVSVGTSVAYAFVSDLLANVGLEVYNKPGEVTVRRALGEQVTDLQAFKESAVNALMGAGIGALAAGLGHMIGKTKPGTKVRAELEEGKAIIEDAAKAVGTPAEGVDVKTHEAAMSKAWNQQTTGDLIDVDDIIPNTVKLTDGDFYHGTNRPLDGIIREHKSNIDSLFGTGFYITDSFTVAKSYGKDTPNVYKIMSSLEEKDFYNLDQHLDLNTKLLDSDQMPTLLESFKELELEQKNVSLADVVVRAKTKESSVNLSYELESLKANLQEQGFKGFSHIGGIYTKSKLGKHNVRILWSPEDSDVRSSLVFQSDKLPRPISPNRYTATQAEIDSYNQDVSLYNKQQAKFETMSSKNPLPEANPTEQQTAFDNLYEQMSVKDQVFKSVDDAGNITETSVKAELDKIKADKAAHDTLIKCLTGVV